MEKTPAHTLARFSFQSIVLLVPLALWLGFFDNVETPKRLVLNSALFAAYAAIVFDRVLSYRLLGSPLLIPALAMVASAGFSSLVAESPAVSWLGEDASLSGGSLVVSLSLAALAVSAVYAGIVPVKLVGAMVVSASLVCLYSLLQIFGLDPFPWNPLMKNRYWIFASLGNPVHLAGFIGAAFWLSFHAGIRSSAAAWLLRAVFVAVMVLTGSRTAVAAFAAGWAVHWLQGRNRPAAAKAGVFAAAAFPFFEPVARIFSFSRIVGARDSIWEGALRLWASRPWLGIGPDMFHSMFPSVAGYGYFVSEPPSITGTMVSLRLPASTHNEILNFAVSQGLIGIGVYLWIIITVVRFGFRSPLLPAAAVLWTMHMTNPSCTATSAVFWVLLGLMASGRVDREAERDLAGCSCPVRPTAVFLAALTLFPLAASLRWTVCQAHKRESGRLIFFDRKEELLFHSFQWSGFAAKIHPAFAAGDAAAFRRLWEGVPSEVALAERAEELYLVAGRMNPRNIFYPAGASDLCLAMGKAGTDRSALDRSEAYARRAIGLAPGIPSLYDDLALVLEAKGRLSDAKSLHRKRREIDPLDLFALSSR